MYITFFLKLKKKIEDFFKEYNEKKNKDIIEDVKELLKRGS